MRTEGEPQSREGTASGSAATAARACTLSTSRPCLCVDRGLVDSYTEPREYTGSCLGREEK